jgi:hypothetical protein
MLKTKTPIMLEKWLVNAIDEWSRENGEKKFSDAVNYLLSCEMNRRNYFREEYEPGIFERKLTKKKLAAEKAEERIIPFDPELSGKKLWFGPYKKISFKEGLWPTA